MHNTTANENAMKAQQKETEKLSACNVSSNTTFLNRPPPPGGGMWVQGCGLGLRESLAHRLYEGNAGPPRRDWATQRCQCQLTASTIRKSATEIERAAADGALTLDGRR